MYWSGTTKTSRHLNARITCASAVVVVFVVFVFVFLFKLDLLKYSTLPVGVNQYSILAFDSKDNIHQPMCFQAYNALTFH